MARPLGKVSAAVPRVQPVAAAKVRRQKAPRRLHDGKFVVSRDDWDYEDPWAPPGRENDEPQPPHTPPVPAPVPLFQMDEAAALRDEAHAALTAAAAREAALTQREAEARAAAEAAAEREKALRASFSEHVAGLEAALRTATAEHSRVAASAAESERVAQAAISEAQSLRAELDTKKIVYITFVLDLPSLDQLFSEVVVERVLVILSIDHLEVVHVRPDGESL